MATKNRGRVVILWNGLRWIAVADADGFGPYATDDDRDRLVELLKSHGYEISNERPE